MLLPQRHGSTADYRYGFQGQEKDDEVKGEGNSLNYKFRMHDPRVGRFFAVDPLYRKYPWNSPYSFSENSVIAFIELEGLEKYYKSGELIGQFGRDVTIRFVNDNEIERAKDAFANPECYGACYFEETLPSNSYRPGDDWAVGDYTLENFFDGLFGSIFNGVSRTDQRFQEDGTYETYGKIGADILVGIITDGALRVKKLPINYAAVEVRAIREAALLSKNKTTSLVGRSRDIDFVAEQTSKVVRNSPNPGGYSRLSNNTAWDEIIEKYKDITDDGARWKAINNEWWSKYNQPWLDEVIERGDDIRLTSDPNLPENLINRDGSPTHFKREIDYLESNDYKIEGDYFVKKN